MAAGGGAACTLSAPDRVCVDQPLPAPLVRAVPTHSNQDRPCELPTTRGPATSKVVQSTASPAASTRNCDRKAAVARSRSSYGLHTVAVSVTRPACRNVRGTSRFGHDGFHHRATGDARTGHAATSVTRSDTWKNAGSTRPLGGASRTHHPPRAPEHHRGRPRLRAGQVSLTTSGDTERRGPEWTCEWWPVPGCRPPRLPTWHEIRGVVRQPNRPRTQHGPW